jgi:hypothetical protein
MSNFWVLFQGSSLERRRGAWRLGPIDGPAFARLSVCQLGVYVYSPGADPAVGGENVAVLAEALSVEERDY